MNLLEFIKERKNDKEKTCQNNKTPVMGFYFIQILIKIYTKSSSYGLLMDFLPKRLRS